MRIIWLMLLTMLMLHATGKVSQVDPFKKIEYFKLDNGMQVYLLADPKAEKTQIELRVNVGYDNETDNNYGISHLVEHLVFRDRRVPHHDYLDYIKEEGGTHVNGYTKRYETGYVATVPAQKSYWVAKTFAQMLFDKNVTDEDLEIERKALQTEIGEPHWYYRPLMALKHFFDLIGPPAENFYKDEFSIPKAKELPDRYHAQENNKRFTLDEVMARYNAYYYPANMKLVIAGNFDPEKMRSIIEKNFGKVTKTGSLKVKEPHYTPKLNGKPYERFYEGMPENYAYVGAKYVLDDYKKYLILNIYTYSLAQRLQQQLRNKHGKTYSVNESGFSDKNAGAALIGFDGLADVFSDNIAEAETMIAQDSKKMEPADIKKAMEQYEKRYYASIEHDSDTLMGLVDMADYLREEHNITDKTSYDIFKSITPEAFQKTVSQTFTPQNRYRYIAREYYYFPMEMGLLSLVVLFFFIVGYVGLYGWQLRKQGIRLTQRDIRFQRRLSSRFMGFLILTATIIIASLGFEWIKYLFSKWVMGDPYWLLTLDVPYSYVATVLDAFVFLLWFFWLYVLLWRYYARIIVTDEYIIATGNRVVAIPKAQIASIAVVPAKERRWRRTLGTMFRFWKPVAKVVLQNGEHYYLRSGNAEHLREDLQKWLDA